MKMSLKKSTYTALLIAFSLVTYIIESAIPPIIPAVAGARLGLSNVFVLYSLYALGWQSALWIVIIKSLLGPILSGMPTGIFFSLAGSILSFSTMLLVKNRTNNKVGIIGVSVISSFSHNIGQFAVAVLFTSTLSIISYFPILALISVVCGIIVGVITTGILKATQNITLKNKQHNIWRKTK